MNNPRTIYENTSLRLRAKILAKRAAIATELFNLVLDANQWNSTHTEHKPIQIALDLSDEITALCINSHSPKE